MIGKEKCRILKEIRKKIADENDIAYVMHECTYEGDCRGTCPKCESELKYLEEQLAARAAAGKRIAIAALCAGMALSMSGCSAFPNTKGKENVEDLGGAAESMPEPDEGEVLDGEVGPDYYDEDELEGAVECPESEEGTTSGNDVPEASAEGTYVDDEPGDTAETAAVEEEDK